MAILEGFINLVEKSLYEILNMLRCFPRVNSKRLGDKVSRVRSGIQRKYSPNPTLEFPDHCIFTVERPLQYRPAKGFSRAIPAVMLPFPEPHRFVPIGLTQSPELRWLATTAPRRCRGRALPRNRRLGARRIRRAAGGSLRSGERGRTCRDGSRKGRRRWC